MTRPDVTYRDIPVIVFGLLPFACGLTGVAHLACRMLACPDNAWLLFTPMIILTTAFSQYWFLTLWRTRRRDVLAATTLAYLFAAGLVVRILARW